MNVGFYLVQGEHGDGYVMADALIRSVRRTMPGVAVTQLTDLESPAVYGVDHVLRQPSQPLALLRTLHQSHVEGEWLFVDTDVVIRRDVRDVFQQSFDIAVVDRDWPHLPSLPSDYMQAMPWNIGVVFSRCPAFWRVVHEALLVAPQTAQDFMGDQVVACSVLRQSDRWRRLELPGYLYNYPPAHPDDHGEDAAIVHYKGERKAWLLRRIAA